MSPFSFQYKFRHHGTEEDLVRDWHPFYQRSMISKPLSIWFNVRVMISDSAITYGCDPQCAVIQGYHTSAKGLSTLILPDWQGLRRPFHNYNAASYERLFSAQEKSFIIHMWFRALLCR